MRYLTDKDRVYTTGCFLVYDEEHNAFRFDGLEDDTFFDGQIVEFDEDSKPYVE